VLTRPANSGPEISPDAKPVRVADNAAMKGSIRKPGSAPASVRFGQRVPVDVHVDFQVDERLKGRGAIRNISISGALLETTLELPLHTNLVLTFSIPGKSAATKYTLDACVVRIDPVGLGIEWRDMGSVDVIDLLEHAT